MWLINDLDKVRTMLDNGASFETIGAEFGVTKQAVGQFIQRHMPDWQRQATCVTCGRNFVARRSHATVCHACRTRARNAQRYTYTCHYCGQSFAHPRPGRKYCSTACSNKAHARPVVAQHADTIKKMYANGVPVRTIAQQYKASVPGVYRVLKEG